MAPLYNPTGLVGPITKGSWWLSWMNRLYGENMGSLIQTKLETPIKHPNSPHPWKVRPRQCAVKVMFIVVSDINGVILHHPIPSRQTVNSAYYGMFLQPHLRPALTRKWQHMVVQNPIILHDNLRSHTTAVMDLLRSWQWEILEHPLNSLDMSPCNYDLFAKVKEPLRGIWYNTRDKLIHATGQSVWTSTKMNMLMVYDAFQTFGKRWQIVGATLLKVHKCCIPVNIAMSEISNWCHYFLSNPCNMTFKLKDVKVLVESAINQVTEEKWKNCIAHGIWQNDTLLNFCLC